MPNFAAFHWGILSLRIKFLVSRKRDFNSNKGLYTSVTSSVEFYGGVHGDILWIFVVR